MAFIVRVIVVMYRVVALCNSPAYPMLYTMLASENANAEVPFFPIRLG